MAWEPIVLDGTGLSGACCDRRVNRRRLLLPSRPAAGTTLVREWCGELGRWKQRTEDGLDWRVLCNKHQREEERPRPTAEQKVRAAVRRYERAVERDLAAQRQLAGAVVLGEITAASRRSRADGGVS